MYNMMGVMQHVVHFLQQLKLVHVFVLYMYQDHLYTSHFRTKYAS